MSLEPSTPVRLVRDFVNTAEPQLGTDGLVLGAAEERLGRLGLWRAGARLGAEDLVLLVAVREGLRERLLDHAGHDVRTPVLDRLDDQLRTVPLVVRLGGGAPVLDAVDGGPAHQVVAAIVTAVVTAPHEEWTRLKVCARDSCRWAFYDASRNRSGRWCSMAGCGNIVKMRRAHRARTGAAVAEDRPG
jgi:predicted RNA-binding Zn ribbon-like protein